MMDNIEKVLYGEAHAPLPRAVAEECQQWKLKFPHLRVVGKAVNTNCMVPKNDQLLLENEFPVTDGPQVHPCDEDQDNLEENKEETYACHGSVEYEPLLGHNFQQEHEPMIDHEAKVVREALVDELTKHVWKEVVEPRVKAFIERYSKHKEEEFAHLPLSKHCLFETCATGIPRILENQNKDKFISSSDPRTQLPQSARELSYTATPLSSNCEPFELHRRYSDHVSLNHRKCQNRLVPGRISEERDEVEDMVIKNPLTYWNTLEAENQVDFNSGIPDLNDLSEKGVKKSSQSGERHQFPSPKCLQTSEVTEELKHRKKSGMHSGHRSEWRSEKMKYSEKHYPQKKSAHVQLPAIEDNRWLTNHQANKSFYGRSSSALPKLAPRILRPTMSSYKNMQGERTTSVVEHLSFEHKMRPLEDELEASKNKLNRSQKYSLGQSSRKGRQERLKREKYFNV